MLFSDAVAKRVIRLGTKSPISEGRVHGPWFTEPIYGTKVRHYEKKTSALSIRKLYNGPKKFESVSPRRDYKYNGVAN